MQSGTANSARIDGLASSLREDGLDAFLANSPITMGYLHGYREDAHERFLTLAIRSNGEVRLICPALSQNQARRCGVEDVRPWRDGEDPLSHFADLARDWDLESAIVAVDDTMHARMLLQVQTALPAALFKAGQETLSKLMRRKDPAEIGLMREAAVIADRAFTTCRSAVRPGVTEREVADALSAAMKSEGGRPTFAIVAAGPNSAEPHHLSDDTRIAEGDVVIMDFGCEVGGYNSDISRTVCCGDPSPSASAVYDVVLRAHHAARKGVRVGAACGEIDALARKVIEEAGYGEFFVHRTGHGIGMQVHEEPYIIGGNAAQLERGNCFSVEPGIYLPGDFGVRIENIVTVVDGGCASLNDEPADRLVSSLD